MAMVQQYRLGDLSKLISSGSDKPESKKKKTDRKLESLFGGDTQNLHVNIVPAVLPNNKIKSINVGANSIKESVSPERKGGTKLKAKRKHKIYDVDNDDEVLSTKSRKSEEKEEAIKPKKVNVSHSPGYCPPSGIVHEATLKQMKTEYCIETGTQVVSTQSMEYKMNIRSAKNKLTIISKKRKNDMGDDKDDQKKDREQQRLKRKFKLKRIKETDPRTIFVGNLPLSVTKKKLLKLFKKYGKIENIRYRCLPPADPKIPKKVIAIKPSVGGGNIHLGLVISTRKRDSNKTIGDKKDFHPQRHNCVAYICFTTKEGAQKALESNGMQLEDLHIHVDLSSQSTEKDKNRSIFVGNVPFDVEEEALRNHFYDCGKIENVRVIRDRKTGLGKGFCYIFFQSKDSVSLALKLNNSELQKRQLRVMRCTSNPSQLGKDVKKLGPEKSKGRNERAAKQGENQQKAKGGDWTKTKKFAPSNMKRSPFQGVTAKSSKFKKRNKEKKKKQKKISRFP